MHSTVYSAFENICSRRNAGGAVLEIGAVPSPDSLLCLRSLRNARYKVGVNPEGAGAYRDFANVLEKFEAALPARQTAFWSRSVCVGRRIRKRMSHLLEFCVTFP